MNIRNLLTRTAAGIIYIAIVLAGILTGKYSFLIVFSLFAGIALYEFYRMTEKNTTHAIGKIFNIAAGVFIFFTVFLYLENISHTALPVAVLVYLTTLICSAIYINRTDILHTVIYSVFGQIYITLPLSLLMLIFYGFQNVSPEYRYLPVLLIFILIWINDTAAYVVGSVLGKHKFVERISPKKTVEGFVGGMLFSIIAGVIAGAVFSLPFGFGMLFGFLVAFFGTMGDLFESLIKRTCNVKDSGTLIPGHGGILDRIDSLLAVIPVIYIYLSIYLEFFA